MRRTFALCCLSLVLIPWAAAQQTKSSTDWKGLQWLIGDWSGGGGGDPGQGTGSFSFQPDLQGKILVRRSSADYAATGDKSAYRHDDLMIVYPEGKNFQAVYFDSEEHMIRYSVELSADGNTVAFVSEAANGSSRFRLTYHRTSESTLSGRFEVAPADKPFATYLEWAAERK